MIRLEQRVWIAGALLLLAATAAHADQQAVIVVHDEPAVEVRATLRDAWLDVRVELRDPRHCIRDVIVLPENGEPIAAADTAGAAWLKGLSIAAGVFAVRRGDGATAPTQPRTNLPQGTQPQFARGGQPAPSPTSPASGGGAASGNRTSGIGVGVGVAIGSALFDSLRSRCESQLAARYALPPGIAPEAVTVQTMVAARGDSDEIRLLQLRLEPSDGEWIGVPR